MGKIREKRKERGAWTMKSFADGLFSFFKKRNKEEAKKNIKPSVGTRLLCCCYLVPVFFCLSVCLSVYVDICIMIWNWFYENNFSFGSWVFLVFCVALPCVSHLRNQRGNRVLAERICIYRSRWSQSSPLSLTLSHWLESLFIFKGFLFVIFIFLAPVMSCLDDRWCCCCCCCLYPFSW